jgi:hypothetical protein
MNNLKNQLNYSKTVNVSKSNFILTFTVKAVNLTLITIPPTNSIYVQKVVQKVVQKLKTTF